jgi:hypothetical protein
MVYSLDGVKKGYFIAVQGAATHLRGTVGEHFIANRGQKIHRENRG